MHVRYIKITLSWSVKFGSPIPARFNFFHGYMKIKGKSKNKKSDEVWGELTHRQGSERWGSGLAGSSEFIQSLTLSHARSQHPLSNIQLFVTGWWYFVPVGPLLSQDVETSLWLICLRHEILMVETLLWLEHRVTKCWCLDFNESHNPELFIGTL